MALVRSVGWSLVDTHTPKNKPSSRPIIQAAVGIDCANATHDTSALDDGAGRAIDRPTDRLTRVLYDSERAGGRPFSSIHNRSIHQAPGPLWPFPFGVPPHASSLGPFRARTHTQCAIFVGRRGSLLGSGLQAWILGWVWGDRQSTTRQPSRSDLPKKGGQPESPRVRIYSLTHERTTDPMDIKLRQARRRVAAAAYSHGKQVPAVRTLRREVCVCLSICGLAVDGWGSDRGGGVGIEAETFGVGSNRSIGIESKSAGL